MVIKNQLMLTSMETNAPHYRMILAADMFLTVNGFYLQKVPSVEDQYAHGDKELANAHVAVVTVPKIELLDDLRRCYMSVAEPLVSIDSWCRHGV